MVILEVITYEENHPYDDDDDGADDMMTRQDDGHAHYNTQSAGTGIGGSKLTRYFMSSIKLYSL